ncbi:MAG: aspartate/glutamate racemase family protein [Chlamydiales bacterium]
MMKPKTIGIVGGAGPLAGASLLERVLHLSGSIYGCYKDADFPKVILLSFPFSEMLSPQMDVRQLQKELNECLKQLRQNGATVLAIACNTLHAFIDETEDLTDLVHFPRALAKEIQSSEIPLIFCTSTSVKFGLHKQFFSCAYPDSQTQTKVDRIIDQILKGTDRQTILHELLTILQTQTASTIILGCTELSLFSKQLSLCNKLIIDPLEIVANKILEKSFSSKAKIIQS